MSGAANGTRSGRRCGRPRLGRSAGAEESKNEDGAIREALDYVRREALKQPCAGVCSVEIGEFAVAGIPRAKGAQLRPQREPPPNAPPPFEAYTVTFTIGPRLFVVNADGGPGQVRKGQVVGAAKALYQRSNAKSDATS